MKLYSIAPLNREHMDEVCREITELVSSGAVTEPLFIMPIEPEGDPPIDKASGFCETFDLYREKLAPIPCGILAQATLGHSRPLNQLNAFQNYVGLSEGREELICCPYDPGFRAHMRGQFRILAEHHPATVMIDDDVELMFRPQHGCACPLHLAAAERLLGRPITREELYLHTLGDSEEDRRITEAFIETQRESVVDAVREFRAGLDEVDPSIQGAICSAGASTEFAAELAAVMAGKGNPAIMRMNNSAYHPREGARGFSDVLYKTARQMAVLSAQKAPAVLLDESDTCPHNRYSVGARQLHSHLTGALLEGANGALHWIERLPALESRSCKAYGEILSRHRGFYETLAALTPTLRWEGARVPLSTRPDYLFGEEEVWFIRNNGWSKAAFERLGLPLYFSHEPGGVALLEGDEDRNFTDGELRGILSGPAFLSGDAAARLCARGFRDLLGVETRAWSGAHPTRERFPDGQECQCQKNLLQLIPTDPSVRTESVVYHLHDGKEKQTLFPGVTVFRNSLGGRIAVFCGTPKSKLHYTEGFSFLNETRKLQLARLMDAFGCLPVWYPGDEELLLKCARMPDGGRFCAIFLLGFDPIDRIALRSREKITAAERLTPDGRWTGVALTREGEESLLDVRAETMDPVILRLK